MLYEENAQLKASNENLQQQLEHQATLTPHSIDTPKSCNGALEEIKTRLEMTERQLRDIQASAVSTTPS